MNQMKETAPEATWDMAVEFAYAQNQMFDWYMEDEERCLQYISSVEGQEVEDDEAAKRSFMRQAEMRGDKLAQMEQYAHVISSLIGRDVEGALAERPRPFPTSLSEEDTASVEANDEIHYTVGGKPASMLPRSSRTR